MSAQPPRLSLHLMLCYRETVGHLFNSPILFLLFLLIYFLYLWFLSLVVFDMLQPLQSAFSSNIFYKLKSKVNDALYVHRYINQLCLCTGPSIIRHWLEHLSLSKTALQRSLHILTMTATPLSFLLNTYPISHQCSILISNWLK